MKKTKIKISKTSSRRRIRKPRVTARSAADIAAQTIRPDLSGQAGDKRPWLIFTLFVLGVVMTALSFSTHPANWDLWGEGTKFEVKGGVFLLALGLLSLAVTARLLPKEEGSPPGLSSRTSWILLTLLLSVGMWLRYSGFWDQGNYWDEMAEFVSMPASVHDLGDFRIVFHQDWPGAFYNYLMVLLWSFRPETSIYAIQRFTPGVMDLFTLWLLYLTGKEVAGRRAGLFTAAVGVLYKPLLWECARGLQASLTPFFGVWTVLSILRFIHKPNLKNSLMLGCVLGLGVYSHNSHRIVLPLFVLGMIAAVLFRLARGASRTFWLTGVFSSMWLISFLVISHLFPRDHVLMGWALTPWTVLTAGVLFSVFGWFAWWKGAPEERMAARWVLSLTLAWILMGPILFDSSYGSRFNMILNTVAEPGRGLAQTMVSAGSGLARTWRAFFLGGSEDGLSLLDPGLGALALFGVCFAVFRRKPLFLFLLILAAGGWVSHALPFHTHNARALAVHAPVMILMGLSLEALCRAFRDPRGGRVLKTSFLMFLLGAGMWIAAYNHRKIHDQWAARPSLTVLVRDLIRTEAPSHRVYVGLNSGICNIGGMNVLGDGMRIYALDERDTVFLGPGEAPPAIVLYLSPNDVKLLKALRSDYPGTEFTPHSFPGQDANANPVVIRARIPPKVLEKSGGDLFTLTRLNEKRWDRQVYFSDLGLCHGILQRDDPASTLNKPFEPEPGARSVRAVGDWIADRAGTYRFQGETCGALQVFLDGRKAIAVRPFQRRNRKFHVRVDLQAGKHSVEVKNLLCGQPASIPLIKVTGPDGKTRLLGDDGLSDHPVEKR